jgi:hypothetical protein
MLKRNAKGIFLMFFILGLPLISWYYLKRGIDFRKERLQSIAEKHPLPFDSLMLSDGSFIVFNQDSSVTAINHFVVQTSKVDDGVINSNLEDLQMQFTGIPNFRFVLLDEALMASASSEYKWEILDSVSAKEFLEYVKSISTLTDDRIYLVDRSGNYRRSYPLNNKDSLVLFVQEAATLLPVKSGQELRFKRKQEI